MMGDKYGNLGGFDGDINRDSALYRLFNDPNHVFRISRGLDAQNFSTSPYLRGLNPNSIQVDEGLEEERLEEFNDAAEEILNEGQREQEEEDALSLDERTSLRKAMDTEFRIRALKDRRNKLKELIKTCKETVVDASRRSAIVDIINGEITTITYELGGLV